MSYTNIITADTTSPDGLVNEIWYLVDATDGDVTLTLSEKIEDGGRITVKKIDSTLNSVFVVTANGDDIEGESSLEICFQYNAARLASHSDRWWMG